MRGFGSSRILQFTMFIQLVCHLLANPVVECAAIFRDFLESAILDLLHSTYCITRTRLFSKMFCWAPRTKHFL